MLGLGGKQVLYSECVGTRVFVCLFVCVLDETAIVYLRIKGHWSLAVGFPCFDHFAQPKRNFN